ncbi:amino acid permease [Pseudomonas chlororaphis]|uniref:amino acid permease n=1 Tax=Pseudomonas chlororaphis TaxID=587753 RepID=UPI000D0F7184|nr:amino acid permease [Pseudomonas chlororaphis]AVO60065.1 GABA permease [Pseudomonas chlororaphis subsp. piscium]UCR83848.1 amino acid permease [Pseudomonas chlororaphis]
MTENKLKQSLKPRHITMIALGGVIGAGLFVGSGSIIAAAGPAAILSYLIGGIIVTLVMLMLGEMASRDPDSGSFSTYASKHLGEWAGYSVGWLYWFKSMITITLEAVLLGMILHDFLPWLPIAAGAVFMLVTLISSNAFSVRSFGEIEYWLSFLKVATIIAFMTLGLTIIFGLHDGVPAPGLLNLTAHGGFMPNGMSPVMAGIIVVIFSLGGSEIAAVAAGESENPRKNIIKAIKTVILRVMIFYIGSVSILILCMPWTDKESLASPYVSLFNMVGFSNAAVIMKIVLFVSFMSVMNSFLYSNSRMLFSLSKRGHAPTLFSRTNARGVPVYALALCFVVCMSILTVHFISNDDLFMTLAKSSGAFVMVVWIFIIIAHFAMRRKIKEQDRSPEEFKAWFYPYSNVVALLALGSVLISQAFNITSRFQFGFTALTVLLIIASYYLTRKRLFSSMASKPL